MVQAEEFKALMQQVMKAHTADLEAIQMTQRVQSATPNSLLSLNLRFRSSVLEHLDGMNSPDCL